METIEATFRVVTPMFMSGAEQTKAELRLPSIKGALRFWWRALAWERHGGNLDKIREEENRLFGSTDAGQAAVLMRLEAEKLPQQKGPNKVELGLERLGGARYLGYGVIESSNNREKETQKGELLRACLPAPFTFTLVCYFKPGTPSQFKGEVVKAIKILGLIGALGSKAHKGYGSVNLINLNGAEPWHSPRDKEELARLVKEVLSTSLSSKDLPEYTAFSKACRVSVVEMGRDPLKLLNSVGAALQKYRMELDDKVVGDYIKGGEISEHPKRALFGLPHNYFFRQVARRRDVKIDVNSTNEKHNRRASPLFIHIHELGRGQCAAIVAVIPAKFLPGEEQIRLEDVSENGRRLEPQEFSQETNDFQVLHDFLDDFPSSIKVLP